MGGVAVGATSITGVVPTRSRINHARHRAAHNHGARGGGVRRVVVVERGRHLGHCQLQVAHPLIPSAAAAEHDEVLFGLGRGVDDPRRVAGAGVVVEEAVVRRPEEGGADRWVRWSICIITPAGSRDPVGLVVDVYDPRVDARVSDGSNVDLVRLPAHHRHEHPHIVSGAQDGRRRSARDGRQVRLDVIISQVRHEHRLRMCGARRRHGGLHVVEARRRRPEFERRTPVADSCACVCSRVSNLLWGRIAYEIDPHIPIVAVCIVGKEDLIVDIGRERDLHPVLAVAEALRRADRGSDDVRSRVTRIACSLLGSEFLLGDLGDGARRRPQGGRGFVEHQLGDP